MSEKFGIAERHWQKILTLLTQDAEITSVILFGSRAMGNFRPGSDIDLCLKGNVNPDTILKILNQYDLLFLPWKLDLVVWNEIQSPDLREHIQRVGIPVRC